MKYRIVKRACGSYEVQRLSGDSWRYVPTSCVDTLDQAEAVLQDAIKNGEKQDEVIKEVEV